MPLARYICATCDNMGSSESMSECQICYQWYCNDTFIDDTCFDRHIEDENDALEDNESGESPRVANFGQMASLAYLDMPYEHHPLMRSKRAASVELEAEYLGVGDKAGDSMELPYDFGTTNDGSLMNGIEVTLPPAKGATLVHNVKTACSMMQEHGYGIKGTCGMHAHIDLRDKKDDKKFLAHLFNTFFSFEDILFAMQTQKRYRSEYTIPLRRSYKFYDMYGQQVDKFDLNFYRYDQSTYGQQQLENEKSRHYGAPRYTAFNFHSVYFRGSLEVRIHDGCLDAERALKWVDLLQHIIARVENGKAHSYRFMSKMIEMPVNEEKLRYFFRYLHLPSDLRSYVRQRIEEGQGMGFNLGEFQWGRAKKGGATRIGWPVRRMRHVGSRIACNCGYEFVLSDHTYCPSCYDPLVSNYGTMRYRLASQRSRERTRSTDSYAWDFFRATPLPLDDVIITFDSSNS